jgi:hypothetical protein
MGGLGRLDVAVIDVGSTCRGTGECRPRVRMRTAPFRKANFRLGGTDYEPPSSSHRAQDELDGAAAPRSERRTIQFWHTCPITNAIMIVVTIALSVASMK